MSIAFEPKRGYFGSWEEGDVIGCKYNIKVISFSVIGNELHEAFTTDKVLPLVPALSFIPIK
jgi:hypothetical protein